jgi:hypothetical protein
MTKEKGVRGKSKHPPARSVETDVVDSKSHWSHDLRSRKFIIQFIASCIIAAAFFLLGVKCNDMKSKSMTHVAAPRKIPQIKEFPATLTIGTESFVITKRNQPIKLTSVSPYTIELGKDGNLLVNGQIKDREGRVVSHIKDSELYVSPGLNYDVNSDMDAIEIVDQQLNVVFQIFITSSDASKSISLTYRSFSFLPNNPNPVMETADDKGRRVTAILSPEDRMKGVKRLFEYPGYEKPGLRKK